MSNNSTKTEIGIMIQVIHQALMNLMTKAKMIQMTMGMKATKGTRRISRQQRVPSIPPTLIQMMTITQTQTNQGQEQIHGLQQTSGQEEPPSQEPTLRQHQPPRHQKGNGLLQSTFLNLFLVGN